MIAIAFEPITQALGAKVLLDADQLLEEGVAEQCKAAMEKYLVLVFPQIGASDELQVAFSNTLGKMRPSSLPSKSNSAADKLGILPITLDPEKAKFTDYIVSNENWHIDGTTFHTPPKATNLKCETPPSSGGDTGFANLYAAYEALPETKKQQLSGLRVVHSAAASTRRMFKNPSQEDIDRWNSNGPPTEQPLVWKQENGRTSMVIGSSADHIVGMPAQESEALLQELLAWSTQDRFVYRHQWQLGDMVIWNNCGLLHKSYYYTRESGRLMHRTVIMGTEAFA